MITPYINTIPVDEEPEYPGDLQLEKRLRSLIRWNAMAMVVRANRLDAGIGGHISTYASAATLLEVGFNHFFRGLAAGNSRDHIYFQGHSSPGIYARAFLEGRLSQKELENFRRELKAGGGLSSYPHPWLMPDFWEFPTVSMGLASLTSIYQARFMRYLENRGIKEKSDSKVWVFLGDGEMDEPESLGALTLASREKLDNLIFVVNCNLQRLDGPVRGNGKIIQELESMFSGAGWKVFKVIWGSDWDPLLAQDHDGILKQRMGDVVDGQYQKYSTSDGAYIRDHFFGTHPELLKMAENLTDRELHRMRRGGHDPRKIFAAYDAAVKTKGQPVVILAKTIKGYGLGESGEGKNISHQQKKLNEDELRDFRSRFGIPISDEDVAKTPFYKPDSDSQVMHYLQERRKSLGGYLPRRAVLDQSLPLPSAEIYEEFKSGTDGRAVSTTMAFVRLLSKLLKDPQIGRRVVPIVPDEARTFGMEGMFRQCGIYASQGQLYEPVDAEHLMSYHESADGQILEEGITEAGSMASFIASGTSYANYGLDTIPFFIFYSMFGFQRIGDFIWAAADSRTKGFMLGATAGRTTLAGEGLQHQDGQSHLMALSIPNLKAYDPAYAYEIAVIIQDGLKRMYADREDVFYYLTVMNENYAQPSMPKGVEEGIIQGLYLLQASQMKKSKKRVHLLGSGALMGEVLKAATVLEKEHGIAADVWSVTSYQQLYQNAMTVDRRNLQLKENKTPVVTQELSSRRASLTVAVSDYVRALPHCIAPWVPSPFVALGTDGFGLSENRKTLRQYFGVDAEAIVATVLARLDK